MHEQVKITEIIGESYQYSGVGGEPDRDGANAMDLCLGLPGRALTRGQLIDGARPQEGVAASLIWVALR